MAPACCRLFIGDALQSLIEGYILIKQADLAATYKL